MKAFPLEHKAKWLGAIPGAIALLVLAATPPRHAAAKPTGSFSKQSQEAADRFDIVIKNGHIIDGTGNPWFAGDVGIREDRIAAIGDLKEADAKRVIDASGKIVSPGFIDMLGQSELSLLIDNRSLSKLSQAITSEITGEAGSVAPQNERTIEAQKLFLNHFHFTEASTTPTRYFK